MAVSRPLLRKEREGESRTPHYTTTQHSLPLDPLVPSFIFPQGTGTGKGKGRRANVLIGIAGERTNERGGVDLVSIDVP